jgi:hypothetical protein
MQVKRKPCLRRPVSLTGTLALIWALTIDASSSVAQESHRESKTDSTRQDTHKKDRHHGSGLSDEKLPLQLEGFPQRPRPILEIGQHFLGTGNIPRGFTLPTGAVWQPYFMLFGTYRSGVNSFYNGTDQVSEWANRFDLFGNLYLTFTERILVGFRPLDQDVGGQRRFTGYTFQPEALKDGFQDETNFELSTLFFEGDFGELFPKFDNEDRRGLDYGISVGRQLINFQEGMLINDIIDAVGITKINLKIPTAVNFRYTLLYGWNQLNRTNRAGSNREDRDASLYALLTEIDWRKSTVALDVIYVNSKDATGDGIHAGLSSVQRFGRYNNSWRILGSFPVGKGTEQNTRGILLFNELAWTPHGNHNFVYFNTFWGIDRFRSAARDPGVGTPLAPRAGVLFAGVGLGRYGAALSPLADNVAGGVLGYQIFSHNLRRQLLLEIGGRYATKDEGQTAAAVGASYQFALGRRWVIRLDGFSNYIFEVNNVKPSNDQLRYGGRLELLMEF